MISHISEEQFILFYYGESTEAAGIESHMAECEACRSDFRTLQLVLNTVDSAPVPERNGEYAKVVWSRLEKQLASRKRRGFMQWWIWAPAMAALVLIAFLAGRWSHKNDTQVATNQQIRERILLVAVGDHLERSQMVLAELTNAADGKGKLDISGERQTAEQLLDDNRLYRQTARSTGDTAVASVLDDLERVLLEISHSPSEVSSDQLDELRQEIESRGLLFKVRVLGSHVRQEESKPVSEKENRKL